MTTWYLQLHSGPRMRFSGNLPSDMCSTNSNSSGNPPKPARVVAVWGIPRLAGATKGSREAAGEAMQEQVAACPEGCLVPLLLCFQSKNYLRISASGPTVSYATLPYTHMTTCAHINIQFHACKHNCSSSHFIPYSAYIRHWSLNYNYTIQIYKI